MTYVKMESRKKLETMWVVNVKTIINTEANKLQNILFGNTDGRSIV